MAEQLTVAEIAGAHGVRGWVKLKPFVEDPATLASFDSVDARPGPRLRGAEPLQGLKVESVQAQGRGVIARLRGVTDRDGAEALRGFELVVQAEQLPATAEDEYYWRDLVGLCVMCTDSAGSDEVLIGRVAYLLETGANDVLVIKPSPDSLDTRERLVPWLPGDVVQDVDVGGGVLRVSWHLDD